VSTDTKPNLTAVVLALMMVMVPAIGVPYEELLQDTLKSIGVSFFALAASFVFFWQQRLKDTELNLHGLLVLPLGLTAYALGSMLWSHTYLGGVEAIRWLVLSLIFFIGLNTWTHARVTYLAWGIHLGAVLASLWTALQFWNDFSFFAQGPNPASTFINRNFFAEFLVCTLPFSVLLLTRLRDKISVFLLTFSLGFNVVALMMTGTRSALIGLLALIFILPVIIYLYRLQCVSTGWRIGHRTALIVLLSTTILALGSIPTHNPKLIAESGQGNAIDRALKRSLSMAKSDEYSHGSFSIRAIMWKATGRMIQANPVTGVGAGAWEVQIPRYQEAGSQLETDYYAHNELLQLLAEYGLAGWLFLLSLLIYLSWAAYKTWSDKTDQGQREAPLRALTLTSLLVFLLVSNAGFPWRMASTGALFALSLSILAASDVRLGLGQQVLYRSIAWKPRYALAALCATAICTGLALYMAQQAIQCESKLVRAIKIALTISQSGKPNDPYWEDSKTEMLQLVQEGIAINPHYRKLTPMVADALASWGDWKNATWIWESVLASRPYVVALLANVARGHMQTGNLAKAQDYINQAKSLQPTAPSLASLEVMLWSRTGQDQKAMLSARKLLQSGTFDYDLVRTSYYLGLKNQNPELAVLALELRIKGWPAQAVDGWIKLGNIYASAEAPNEAKALQAYQTALAAAPPSYKKAVLTMIPPSYHARIQ
jgi:O-antigen ligase